MIWVEYNGRGVAFEQGTKVNFTTREGVESSRAMFAKDLRWSWHDADNGYPENDIVSFSVVAGSLVENPPVVEVKAFNPVALRDRVIEIDETLLTLDEERVTIILQLALEGFILSSVTEPVVVKKPEPEPVVFEEGDIVRLERKTSSITSMLVGMVGTVTQTANSVGEVEVDNAYLPASKDLELISRGAIV